MEQRPLGRTGIVVSRIGLGCVTFGREISEDESFRILDYAFEHGITLFDTAEAYGEAHASERILGRWLAARGCRSEVVLQSKISAGFTRAHVHEALEASLERLGADSLDIYLFHNFDAASGIEEAVAAMTDAVRGGLARCYGCSNFNLGQLRSAVDAAARGGGVAPGTIEPIYNLVDRSAEDDLFPYCAENGIGVTGYSPLGAGFLTGKYTEDAAADPPESRFGIKPGHRRIYCTPHGFRVLEGLKRVSAETGVAMTRLAMGWAFRHAAVASVLVGATRVDHVRQALEALARPLPEEIARRLDAISTSQPRR